MLLKQTILSITRTVVFYVIGNPFRLNPYYLKLFFESSAFANQYLSESDGTTVATLTMVRLNRYLIPVPPLKEQTRIVEKIKTVTSIMRG